VTAMIPMETTVTTQTSSGGRRLKVCTKAGKRASKGDQRPFSIAWTLWKCAETINHTGESTRTAAWAVVNQALLGLPKRAIPILDLIRSGQTGHLEQRT
jgi:hypothetical protein